MTRSTLGADASSGRRRDDENDDDDISFFFFFREHFFIILLKKKKKVFRILRILYDSIDGKGDIYEKQIEMKKKNK